MSYRASASVLSGARVEQLPDRLLRLLVAITTSWQTRGRSPSARELDRLGIAERREAVSSLLVRGWLVMDWRYGRRLRHTLRPTAEASRQLYREGRESSETTRTVGT